MTRLLIAILVALTFAVGACSGGLDGDAGLADEARTAIESPGREVYVSAASAWEMSIKRAMGHLHSPPDIVDAIGASGFDELPIRVAHAQSVGSLAPHHADPLN